MHPSAQGMIKQCMHVEHCCVYCRVCWMSTGSIFLSFVRHTIYLPRMPAELRD